MAGGRPPSGPKLVENLDGSTHAKTRLETILETIAGTLSVAEACARLGIGETAFAKIRATALAAALKELEPKALGRPSRSAGPEGGTLAALEARAKWLEEELEVSRVREELAAVLPYVTERGERQERRAEEKKRRRRERRAQRGASLAPGGGGDGPSGAPGDPPGGVRPGAAGGDGPRPPAEDDAGPEEAGTP